MLLPWGSDNMLFIWDCLYEISLYIFTLWEKYFLLRENSYLLFIC